MKKLLVVLLSLTLIVGFSMTASALDFKLSGGYHLYGVYMDNPQLQPDATRYSRADFRQRVRMQPVLSIADGLTFTMRFDALEKKWGDTNWKNTNPAAMSTSNTDDSTSSRNVPPAGVKMQENIEFERGIVTFKTAIGQFDVGYQASGPWGTKGLQQDTTRPRIRLVSPFGPVSLIAIYEKRFDGGESPVTPTTFTDADNDNYNLAVIYNNGKNLQAGLLYQYALNDSFRPAGNNPNGAWAALGYGSAAGFRTKISTLAPYFQASFGPLFLEAEVNYMFGKLLEQEVPTAANPDVDIRSWGAFAHAKLMFGPAYAALQFHYTTGDDLKDPTKSTLFLGPTTSWTPVLMMLCDGMSDMMGGSRTVNGLNQGSSKANSTIFAGYAGYNVNPRLNIEIDMAYALASQKALTRTPYTEATSDKIGTEVDISATYKLYDNLTYHVAAGYMWTGDYYKGANAAAEVGNNYAFMNRLIMAF